MFVSTSDITIAAHHATRIPAPGNDAASTTTNPTLATANNPLSATTHGARRRPVSTASWSSNTVQAIVAATNTSANHGDMTRKSSPNENLATTARKATARTPAHATLTRYDARTSRRTPRPAAGTKRISALMRLISPNRPSSVRAEIAAWLRPTAAVPYRWVATTQNATPVRAVIADPSVRVCALRISGSRRGATTRDTARRRRVTTGAGIVTSGSLPS